jgi:hypothetical protein
VKINLNMLSRSAQAVTVAAAFYRASTSTVPVTGARAAAAAAPAMAPGCFHEEVSGAVVLYRPMSRSERCSRGSVSMAV